MQAAFYAKQGPAREVLQVGEQPTPEPGPGEVRVHLKTSAVNPSDWKSRSGRTAPISAPLIIPHGCAARVSLLPSANLRRQHMLVAPAQMRSSIIGSKMSVGALRHHSF